MMDPSSPLAATAQIPHDDRAAPGALADLQTLWEMWQAATDRLQRSHELLLAEVRRLSGELEEKNRELARQNRLADLGTMASHVAHEVRNGLAPLTLYLSLLRRRLEGAPEPLALLAKVETGLAALQTVVSDLLHFTADRTPQRMPLDVNDVVHEIRDALAPQFAAQQIDFRYECPPHCELSADRDMLRRALINLVLNAVDAMPRGGDLVLTACPTPHGVELEVADSGAGLPEGVRARIFDPFFTTKQGGTGLGLAIVDRIAIAHGGFVSAQNCPEGGAAFTLHIPACPQESP